MCFAKFGFMPKFLIRGSGGTFSEILEVCFSLAEPRGDLLEKIGIVVLGALRGAGATPARYPLGPWGVGLAPDAARLPSGARGVAHLEPGAVPGDVTKYRVSRPPRIAHIEIGDRES